MKALGDIDIVINVMCFSLCYYVTVGTRYKRRGVDVEGHVANYVETEMLVECGIHVVSYILVRGSVPIYWTQPGYKYRPPPVIEKGNVICKFDGKLKKKMHFGDLP